MSPLYVVAVSEEHFANFGTAVYTCWNMMLIPAKAEEITKVQGYLAHKKHPPP